MYAHPLELVIANTIDNNLSFSNAISQFLVSVIMAISTSNVSVGETLNVLTVSGYACQQMSEYLTPAASLLATQRDQSFSTTCQCIILNTSPAW